jgi:hypothetical protein
MALATDADFGVRKAAVYRLGLLRPDHRVADFGWDYLHRPDVFGVHATETLGTFVAHADRTQAVPRLASVAADRTRRESLRVAAVHALARLEAAAEVNRWPDYSPSRPRSPGPCTSRCWTPVPTWD